MEMQVILTTVTFRGLFTMVVLTSLLVLVIGHGLACVTRGRRIAYRADGTSNSHPSLAVRTMRFRSSCRHGLFLSLISTSIAAVAGLVGLHFISILVGLPCWLACGCSSSSEILSPIDIVVICSCLLNMYLLMNESGYATELCRVWPRSCRVAPWPRC
jgi:hypothetical protein